MKILAFSDLHGDEIALERLVPKANGMDHTMICGDISHTNTFAESVLNTFPKSLVIPGNWDNAHVNRLLGASKQWVQEKRVELMGGYNAVGFGFSPPTPYLTHGELRENEIYVRMSKLPIDNNTILMLHCPPKGYFDFLPNGQSAGSESILKIINEKRPLAAIFGHIHEHKGIGKIGPTTLIKLPAAKDMQAGIISIRGRDIEAEFITL